MISESQRQITRYYANQELLRRASMERFNKFVLWMKADYEMHWFHRYICEKLDAFEQGKIKKLMILVPPQHGKTELATRLFTPYLLGKNPDRKIAIATYAEHIAQGFNRDIQRYMDSERYLKIFPETMLNGSMFSDVTYANYTRTAHKFDVVNHRGTLKTVGRGGGLTSETVDIGVIDDLYKDREEARSPTVSEGAWTWYIDVFRTRFHNNSQQLMMNTRWDENDLAGRLLLEEQGEWEVIKFPAIKTKDINDYDPRSEGEVLWENRHSLEKIIGHKHLSEASFNSLYQQDPKPNEEVLIFKNWIEVPRWPDNIEKVSWGLDFGKTTGTNALIKCGETSEGYFFHEAHYERGTPVSDIYKALMAHGYRFGQPVYADHEWPKINALILMQVSIQKAMKGGGSVSFGITELNKKKVFYTADSINLKRELLRYQWKVFGKIITNEPDPNCSDHAMDACRYASVAKYFGG